MKKIIAVLIFLVICGYGFSQQQNEKIEKEVNEVLWKPFKKAFENSDWKLFNSLHTDDVLRVNKWGIKIGDEYKQSVKESYQGSNTQKRTIDFWLEHRIYSNDTGYEVGYFRIRSEQDDGKISEFFGRFHIVLKKIDGIWKIAQDWDTNEINGDPVTSEDFAKGVPLDLKS